jgi:hypothetical protein
MMKTFEEEVQANPPDWRYIGCGKCLKAIAADEKRCSTDIHDWVAGW